jgi:hypothetical protein
MNVGHFVYLMQKKRLTLGRLTDSDEYVLRNLRLTPHEMTLDEHIDIFSALPRYMDKFNQNLTRMAAWTWFTRKEK